MNAPDQKQMARSFPHRPGPSRFVIGLAAAGGGVLILAVIASLIYFALAGALGSPALVLYTVKRIDLPITVTERGNLESQSDVNVLCEVDDIEGDNMMGTPIIWIIPNGESVKKGDLIVELDAASHQERLDRQILSTEKARSEEIQATVKFENQKTQNTTLLAEAKLKVDLAELALKQFEDDDGGTFQIDLQDIELQIQEAQASKLIEETNLQGVEQLHKLGYRSSGELAQARLSAMKAERLLATAISKKKELVEYQYRKTRLELEGQVASAKRSLEQVERDNVALLTQSQAAMDAAKESLKKEEERLKRYREQVTKCKIYAPQDGMVAYSSGGGDRRWREDIREGAPVRPRQTILSIPNLTRMQVKTAVHESVLDQVRPGLAVTIRVDAFPDRTYSGIVRSVAVLPDQDSWMGSDTKVYRTVVTLEEEVQQLKPGMTAVVEIHIDLLRGVIAVPVQAIQQVRRKSWVRAGPAGSERREIKLGRTNDKFVEIIEGLAEGDLVVLNPEAIPDESRHEEPGHGATGSPPAPETIAGGEGEGGGDSRLPGAAPSPASNPAGSVGPGGAEAAPASRREPRRVAGETQERLPERSPGPGAREGRPPRFGPGSGAGGGGGGGGRQRGRPSIPGSERGRSGPGAASD